MLPDELSHTVGTCIASPRADKHQPDRKYASFKEPGLINIRKHHCHIKHAEKRGKYLLRIIFRIIEHKHTHLADQICHKQQHKPRLHHARELELKIQQPVIQHCEKVTHDPRRLFLDTKHFIQLCHSDQADQKQHPKEERPACDHCDKSNDH